MAEKINPEKRSFSILTAVGIVFALLLCLLSSAMVMVTFPGSLGILEYMLLPENSSRSSNFLENELDQTPTPFQPFATEISVESTQETQEGSPEPEMTQEPTSMPLELPAAAPTVEKAVDEPEAIEIPLTASINGLYGTPQLYNLDCESQSAVNFAQFFGVNINELDFINKLPLSDDPEEGFVGTINGAMGQLPPSDYGVHAKPIAKLLREYGLNAKAVKGWDLDNIRKEITAGRPVIVWIVNMPFDIESMDYTASNGNTTRVARFEHTWIITGYNMNVFTVVDSEWTYNVKIATFQERWDALGNQAVIYRGK
jgi:uncharacterized protein YvpB